ncbi:MAG: PAS domain S-box protein [Nitrospira sp.]
MGKRNTGNELELLQAKVAALERALADRERIVGNEVFTDQNLTEEQAHLFRTLMDHSSDAVFVCDPRTGRFMDVNASACRHLGYGREELLRLCISDIEQILPNRASWPDVVAALKQMGARTVMGWYRRKDGSLFPVEVNAGFGALGRGDVIVAIARDISDRERAEEQLRQSEERFRTLIQYSSDIITVLNPDATIRYESPAFYRLFGYREEDVLGMNAFHFVHPDHRERTMEIFRERLHTPGLAEPLVFGFRKADGGYLTLEVVGNNLLHDPSVQGIVVNCREVTGRIRAEEALRASEAKLRTLADHAPVSIFVSDPACQCVYVNQRWCGMTGYSATEAYGKGWLRTVPHDQRAHIERYGFDEQPAAMPPLEKEYRFLTKDGSVRWAEGSTVPLRNARQEIIGFISTSTDITERRKAEEELRMSHDFIRHIIDTNPNLIFAKDREGRFALVNKAAADFYGTTVDDLIGKTDGDFNTNAEEVAAIRRQDLEVMDTLTELFISEEIMTDAAGNRHWLQTVKRPLLDETGRASQVLGASADITVRKQVEEALRQREQDLQTALTEREQISQELHDGLLQSLYAVGLGLETCRSLIKRNSKRAAPTLEQAVNQLNAVMREVRNFIAGLDSELVQGGDLCGALRTVVESLDGQQKLPFRVAIDEQAARHISREQGLHVLNVVREAVSNSLRHAKASRGTISLRRLKRVVRVTVRDNGIGFNPKAVTGLGYGLTNMAARAKRVGARLLVDSKPKHGTRIVFDLPRDPTYGRS